MSEQKRLSLAGVGCGSRTRTYMKLAMEQKNRYRIAAAADPVKQRTEAVRDFAPEEERDSVRLFKDAASLLAEPRLADVAIIGTQDDYHYAPCRKAMELGYHVLLEKPIAKTLKEALELRDMARALKRRVAVCHVLRYTQFYRTLKKIIDSGEIGDVITFNANEGVGAWHFAHSFVRGHWGNSKTSTPMIVAKCCHDMDILTGSWAGVNASPSPVSGSLPSLRKRRSPHPGRNAARSGPPRWGKTPGTPANTPRTTNANAGWAWCMTGRRKLPRRKSANG